MGGTRQSLDTENHWRRGLRLGLCGLILLLGSCRAAKDPEVQPPRVPTVTPAPVPLNRAVATFTPTAVIEVVAQAPPGTPVPTPTPQTYIVAAGDTLIGIGAALGMDPADLQDINHIADPRTLQIGQSLIVPSAGGQPVLALPPLPHRAQGLQAYVDGLGIPWMLGEIVNLSAEVVEQVRVEVLLLDAERNEVARGQGLSYRYLTPPQEASPFMVALDAEEGSWDSWLLAVTSSHKAHAGRLYTDLEVQGLAFGQVSDNMVRVQGQLRNTGAAITQETEAVLVLYSHAGGVVGMRIVPTEVQALMPGDTSDFRDTVLTIGVPVARVAAIGQGIRAE